MKTVILCGGMGTRLREETEFRPKSMVEIGGRPILWHIMKGYASHGFYDFILCLGYRADVIKSYFFNYHLLNQDFTIRLGSPDRVSFHGNHLEHDWNITLADTGIAALTGARVKRIQPYITGDNFMLTYGDGVADVDIRKLLDFHRAHGKIGTVTGVRPPSRFGELQLESDQVVQFSEKPQVSSGFINGGFFVFNKEFFNYVSDDDTCSLEGVPLEHLARDGELKVYTHTGFWQCMDTSRDLKRLRELWESGQPQWKVWR